MLMDLEIKFSPQYPFLFRISFEIQNCIMIFGYTGIKLWIDTYKKNMYKYLQEEDSVLHGMFTGEMGNLLTSVLFKLNQYLQILRRQCFPGDMGNLLTDSKGRVFIDRDGVLFRFIIVAMLRSTYWNEDNIWVLQCSYCCCLC